MAIFKVNGRTVRTEKNQKLLRFLRDELHLTSVKDGCSEGACGACTVIIDGKTCKACVPDTDLLEGRDSHYRGRSDRMGKTGLYLCIWKGRSSTVWILYSGNGDVYQGTSGRKIKSLLMMKSGMHCEITTAAVPDM